MKCTSLHYYGAIGAIFAGIYMVVTVVASSFDSAIAPYFADAQKNRHTVRAIIIYPLLGYTIVSMVGLIVLYCAHLSFINISTVFNHTHSILFVAIALCESLRKIAKSLLQLIFKPQLVAGVETTMLSVYTIAVWMGYAAYGALSVEILFYPLLITSLLALIRYAWALKIWYCSLSQEYEAQWELLRIQIWKTRLITLFNVLGHTLFSSNFLVAFIAAAVGLEHAGTFKLISYGCYLITPPLQKIFGVSSQAIFVHLKKHPLQDKLVLFSALNKRLILTLAVIYAALIPLLQLFGQSTMPIIIQSSFIAIILSENLLIVYEKLCIAEGRVAHLLVYHGVCVGLLYYCLPLGQTVESLIFAILAIRAVSFIGLVLIARILWRPNNFDAARSLKTDVQESYAFLSTPDYNNNATKEKQPSRSNQEKTF